MIRVIRVLLVCLWLLASAAPAAAQLVNGEIEREAVVTLDTGEVLRGPIIERTAQYLRMDHVILGEITIPIVRTASIDFIAPGAGPGAIEPPVDQDPVTLPNDEPKTLKDEPKPEESPAPIPPKWSGSLEMGINGTEGNTETQRARLVFDARRQTERETFDLRVRYQAAQSRGDTTENRLTIRAKNEWATSKAKWRIFLEGAAERDEFLDFDWRVLGNSGFAYDFIKNDVTSLVLRAGLGGSIEFGSANDGFDPEGVLAYEFRHKINKRMTFTSNAELFPDLKEFGEFRSRINAALDTNLDDAGAWRLRIGVEDRYESNTSRAEKNDFDYFLSIVYRF